MWAIESMWQQCPGGAAPTTTWLMRPTDSGHLRVTTHIMHSECKHISVCEIYDRSAPALFRCKIDRAFTQLILWQN